MKVNDIIMKVLIDHDKLECPIVKQARKRITPFSKQMVAAFSVPLGACTWIEDHYKNQSKYRYESDVPMPIDINYIATTLETFV